MNTKNKPVHDVRLGAIKAAIWANSTPKGTRYSVTLTRLYKDGDWALGSEVCHPHRDADRRSLVCTYPVSESDHPTSLGRLRRKR